MVSDSLLQVLDHEQNSFIQESIGIVYINIGVGYMHFPSELRSDRVLLFFQNDIGIDHVENVVIHGFFFIEIKQVSRTQLGIFSIFCTSCHHTHDNKNDITKPEAVAWILNKKVSDCHLLCVLLKLLQINLNFNLLRFWLLFLFIRLFCFAISLFDLCFSNIISFFHFFVQSSLILLDLDLIIYLLVCFGRWSSLDFNLLIIRLILRRIGLLLLKLLIVFHSLNKIKLFTLEL